RTSWAPRAGGVAEAGPVGGVDGVVAHRGGPGDRPVGGEGPFSLEAADGGGAEAVLGEVVAGALGVVVVHGPVVRVGRGDVHAAEGEALFQFQNDGAHLAGRSPGPWWARPPGCPGCRGSHGRSPSSRGLRQDG